MILTLTSVLEQDSYTQYILEVCYTYCIYIDINLCNVLIVHCIIPACTELIVLIKMFKHYVICHYLFITVCRKLLVLSCICIIHVQPVCKIMWRNWPKVGKLTVWILYLYVLFYMLPIWCIRVMNLVLIHYYLVIICIRSVYVSCY